MEKPKAEPAPARPAESGGEETVRIATARLDQIMAQVGELQVVRNSLSQALAEMRAVVEEMNMAELTRRRARQRQQRLALEARRNSSPSFDGRGLAFASNDHFIHNGIAPADPSSTLANGGQNRALLEEMTEQDSHSARVRADVNALYRRLKLDNHRLGQVVMGLQEDVRRTRLQPIATVFEAFPRMVRDIARTLGKQIDFVLEGGETEMDRSLNERMKSPLLHLLRNAIDHGIETPEARLAAGKPAKATLRLRAAQVGSNIQIVVQDDGGGIDVERVVARAIERKLLSAEEAKTIDRQEAIWLIFRSGFSTATAVSEISGRGIGMDVVRQNVEEIHGMIDVATEQGVGTAITLVLPLTVATTLVLLVKCSQQTFAIPVTNINRIARLAVDKIGYLEGSPVIQMEQPILLVHLSHVLGLGLGTAKATPTVTAVVLGLAERRVAVLIDELLGIQEVVVKGLPPPFHRVKNIAGASILGSGDAVTILNVADILRSVRRGSTDSLPAFGQKKAVEKPRPWILVADDSMTTRTLEKNILEMAGYRVHPVADGQEAWEVLQKRTFDLLVSDVNMPRMDGFALTATVRQHSQTQNLPVILVTSLDSADDRKRGVEAGADAYIVKGAFDQQQLLDTVQSLI
jgi:two-component system, chemotaxis family, sensor kinase CheA